MQLSSVAPFVPRLVIDNLRKRTPPLEAVEQCFDAAVMLADVSGFTRLAEQLEREHASASEELTRILNAFFAPVIEAIERYGGDVVKFAGDALIVLWPADAGVAHAVHAATECGLALQAIARGLQTAGSERLSVKISISAGPMRISHVGGVRARWELMVTGTALSQLGSIASLATPGEVILTRAAHAEIESVAVASLIDPRFVRVASLGASAGVVPGAHKDAPDDSVLAGYVPELVRARLRAHQSDWLSELRRVTVIFVNFPNATYETTLERAHGIMRMMQAMLDRYEGAVNKLSVDEKGVSMVVVFGLPTLAHDDDPARALLAALSLAGELRARDVRHGIGLTTGTVFCGVVGSRTRREYTVMGDVVNLAARLMSAAHDDVFCDEATMDLARDRVRFEALPPIAVKGKAAAIAVYRPLGEVQRADAIASTSAIVGRLPERRAIAATMDALSQTRASSALVFEGESGIGKSRLLDEVREQGGQRGLRVFEGSGDAIDQGTAYHAWRSVLVRIARGMAAESDPATDSVAHALVRDTDDAQLTPLLAAVLRVAMADNDLTAQMTGVVRADNTRELLIRVIQRAAARGEPFVLVLDDAHWLDSASWALLLAVAQRVRPIVIAIGTRPLVAPVPAEFALIDAALETTRFALGALSSAEAVALVCKRLGVASIPLELERILLARADGHPFFAEAIAYAMRETGFVRVTAGVCEVVGDLSAAKLPHTIKGLVASRIDRLEPGLQLTLKVASVIGRSFELRVLHEIFPLVDEKPRLAGYLDTLDRLDLTVLDAPDPDRAHSFKHAITRESVYEQLLVSQRRDLHRAVAVWIEANRPADGAALAHHYARAGDDPRTLNYSDLAAVQALQRGGYREATRFLRDAIALESRVTSASHEGDSETSRARRRTRLADAQLGTGLLADARTSLDEAVAILGVPLPSTPAGWLQSTARNAARQAASRIGTHDRSPTMTDAERERILEAARAFERLGVIFFFLNDPLKTLYSSIVCANLCERAGSPPDMARAYGNLCVGTSLVPVLALSNLYGSAARSALRGVTDLATIAWVDETVALVRAGQGAFAEAAPLLTRATEINTRLGDARRAGECAMIDAAILWARAEWASVHEIATRMAEGARNHGDEHMRSGARAMQGGAMLRLRRLDDSRELLTDGAESAKKCGARAEEIFARGLLSLTYVRLGDHARAASEADETARVIAMVMPTAMYAMEGWGALAESEIALSGRDRTREKKARDAVTALRRYARTFPIATARASFLAGLLEWRNGATRSALANWRASLAAAERYGQPYEIERARHQLAAPDTVPTF